MSDEPPNSLGDPLPARGGGPFGRLSSARPEGSPYPKAELLPRLLARLTDFTLAAMLPIVGGDAGGILAALYLLFADGMFRGQSPGKKLLGIKVVHLASRCDVDYRESALRNFPFALALLFRVLPSMGGLPFAVVGGAVLSFEAWQVVSDRLGLRMGDLFAGTQVVDTKVLASQRPALKAVPTEGSHARSAARLILLEPPRSRRQAR